MFHTGDERQHLVNSSSFSHGTNIGIPGVYAYRIDESQITEPGIEKPTYILEY